MRRRARRVWPRLSAMTSAAVRDSSPDSSASAPAENVPAELGGGAPGRSQRRGQSAPARLRLRRGPSPRRSAPRRGGCRAGPWTHRQGLYRDALAVVLEHYLIPRADSASGVDAEEVSIRTFFSSSRRGMQSGVEGRFKRPRASPRAARRRRSRCRQRRCAGAPPWSPQQPAKRGAEKSSSPSSESAKRRRTAAHGGVEHDVRAGDGVRGPSIRNSELVSL